MPSPTQDEEIEMWRIVLTLSDAIATIERKYHHKEITYDEYEEHSKRYETQATTALHRLMLKERLAELQGIRRPHRIVDGWASTVIESNLVRKSTPAEIRREAMAEYEGQIEDRIAQINSELEGSKSNE
jgi:hypothetical protein